MRMLAGLTSRWMIGGCVLVQVAQRFAHLADPGQHQGFVERAVCLLEHGAQVFAGDEVHHQVLALPGDGEVIDHHRQVGVAQPG